MQLLESTTVKFNLYTILATLLAILGVYTVTPNLSPMIYVVLGISSMLISELITYANPSGGWAFQTPGNEGDWTAGKWIYRIGNSVLIVFAYMKDHGWLLQVVALTTPVLEIIIRRWGSNTTAQRKALQFYKNAA